MNVFKFNRVLVTRGVGVEFPSDFVFDFHVKFDVEDSLLKREFEGGFGGHGVVSVHVVEFFGYGEADGDVDDAEEFLGVGV